MECERDENPDKLVESSELKCVRAGCTNKRYEDGAFCLSCLTKGLAKMRAGCACDNLPALP